MNEPRNLAEALDQMGERAPGRGYRFIKDEKWAEKFVSFAHLEKMTAGVGAALQDLGLKKGDRAALILPDADAFIPAFLGALRAGVIPVPIYPPTGVGQLSGYLDNTRHIVERSGSKALVTIPMIRQVLGAVQASCPALQHIVNYSQLEQSNAPLRPVTIQPSDTAFLQFTSGSTSRPKGVVLTHGNLLANIRNIIVEGLKADPSVDTGLTWLPLFHDMGLIGFVLAPMVVGIQVTFMSPLMFLKRPASWLHGMSRYRASISFGPNFAYALAVKRVKPRELEGVDLSTWRVAGCGAEPIRAETLEHFADTYAAYGFRKESFYPAYGLAESTLAVAFSKSVPTDDVASDPLWSEGKAVKATNGATDVIRIVNCGKAFAEHDIQVFEMDDERSLNPLPDRVVGEIRLRGPSVAAGYFEDPERTAKDFVDGWFRTGDLGYMADGNVHICGRSKEVIIINGRNFYPQDIEWEASQIDGVRKGNVIAFGTSGEDRERVVLAYETTVSEAEQRQVISSQVRARVQESVGLALDDVVPVAAGVLPKTSSGKLQRTRTKELYETGELMERKSGRKPDRVDQVKELARSQLGYMKLAIFGGRKS